MAALPAAETAAAYMSVNESFLFHEDERVTTDAAVMLQYASGRATPKLAPMSQTTGMWLTTTTVIAFYF